MKTLFDALRVVKRRILFDPLRITRLEEKVDAVAELIKATHDIRAVPKASGIRRMSQLANALLLKRVTDVLDRQGIPYWLIAGSLLGAVRHGGSIPWDDDVDIGVMRADHNQLVDILNREFAGTKNFLVVKSDAMRVMLTDSSCQVDVFPFDEYQVTEEALPDLKREYLNCKKLIRRDWTKLNTRERTIVNMTDEQILECQKSLSGKFNGDKRILTLGIESGERSLCLMWDRDWVFPLQKMKYELFEFSVPNKPELALLDHYGDFMKYPKEMHAHDDIEERLTIDAYRKFEHMLRDAGISG